MLPQSFPLLAPAAQIGPNSASAVPVSHKRALVPLFETTMSCFPSPLKSPITVWTGPTLNCRELRLRSPP